MFCRNCGKELSDKAIACVSCGMNPKGGNAHCPSCGAETKDKQIICTSCGGSLKGSSSDVWSTGAYVGFIVLSVIIRLFGWIYGGIHMKNAADGSQRKKQAWHFVIAGIVGFVLAVIAKIG